jgi:hypothetical protein
VRSVGLSALGLLGYIDPLDENNLARLEQNARYIFCLASVSLRFSVEGATMWTFYFDHLWWNVRKEFVFTFIAGEFAFGFVCGFEVFKLEVDFDFCVRHILV